MRIRWNDGHVSVFGNKALREACPCAACKGERGILGKMYTSPSIQSVPDDIRAVGYSMVGRYAISFDWSDGHKTGIYSYDYLLELCECEKCKSQKSA
jgi:DUF971 family protein